MNSLDRAQAIEAIRAIVLNLSMAEPRYYSQDDSPLGKRRHLELVRKGELNGFKQGRLRLVKREDVHDFIEANPVKPFQETTDDNDQRLRDELNALDA